MLTIGDLIVVEIGGRRSNDRSRRRINREEERNEKGTAKPRSKREGNDGHASSFYISIQLFPSTA